MPGFVDTHRHTWQSPFRGVCADWTLEDYFRGIRTTISPNCSAADVYAGNHLGALEALDAGVTTILDFSHCNNTPEHADARASGTARRRASARSSPTATTRRRRRAGVHRPRAAPGRRAPDPLRRAVVGRRAGDDGRGAHRGRPAAVRRRRSPRRARRASWACRRCSTPAATGARRSPRGSPSSTTTGCSAPTRCTCTATRSTTATSAGWPTTTARSPRARRPRSRWAWDTP